MAIGINDIPLAAAQAVLLFLIAPLLIGIMHKVKARFQGRLGAPIHQPYIDTAKLLMKGVVISPTSSWIFLAAPILTFASMLVAAAALPLVFPGNIFGMDMVMFVYLFAIGRFMASLAGLDIGSAFGGLGASREMLYSSLIEPVMFAAIVFLATAGAGIGLGTLAAGSSFVWPAALLSPVLWLAGAALFIVIIAETGRLPFDNPATHLELTMVHEAMVLDYSGPLLALIEWANAAKITILFSLFILIFTPIPSLGSPQMPIIPVIAFFAALCAMAVFTASLESLMPKTRLFRVSELLTFSLILSFLAFFFTTTSQPGDVGAIDILAALMLILPLYFIFSSSFDNRIRNFLYQSLALAAILLIVALKSGSIDAYWRLGSTLVFKVFLVPWLLLRSFHALEFETALKPRHDPIFFTAPLSTQKSLLVCGALIFMSYTVSSILGVHNSLLPVAFSTILIGAFIIAIKSHVYLQMVGFLIMENGLVLLPVALNLSVPILGELVAFIDTLTLVAVSLFLASKINDVNKSLDSLQLNRMIETK